MGTVEAPASVLAVGEPYYDSAGRLEGWERDPLFLTEFADPERHGSADSWERLALAVAKAAYRFGQIGERGNVVARDDLGSTDEYTPNYVSDPGLTVRGVRVVADTKGMLSRDMGEAMLRTLVEELQALPFDTRVSGSDDDADSPCVEWRPPHVVALGRARPRLFAIERNVRCVLRDGVPDVVVEYLDTEGGWTTSSDDARRFERTVQDPNGKAALLADRLALSMLGHA